MCNISSDLINWILFFSVGEVKRINHFRADVFFSYYTYNIMQNKVKLFFFTSGESQYKSLHLPVRIPSFWRMFGKLLTESNELKWCIVWCKPYIPFWWDGNPVNRLARLGEHELTGVKASVNITLLSFPNNVKTP